MESIIATHTIKPSSPTPVGLKTHKLSSLDQVMPPVYVPLIFLYKNDDHSEISRRLRQSLSDILTVFYPLAGTIKENSFVDCNDSGVEMVEARVHARLVQFVADPKMEELDQLIPIDSEHYNDNAILSVKLSFFECGGFAVGVCMSHKIGDAASLVAFMTAWAATCRGEASGIIHPSFDSSRYFLPGDIPSFPTPAAKKKKKFASKRIVFDREKLEKLKKKAASDEVKDPSRAEAVAVLIWLSFIEAHKAKSGPFMASQAVNLRPRTEPPIPDHTFGNCATAATAVVSSEGGVDVSKLRAAVRALEGDLMKKNITPGEVRDAGEVFQGGSCVFSSWCRFPVYEVDLGWGKPVWVGTADMPSMNVAVLMSTPSGDGIEAWISAPHHDFFKLLQIILLLD